MTSTVPEASTWKFGDAPGAWPLLGHSVHMLRDPQGFLASLPAHGDLVRLRFGPWHMYMVCHPDLVHHVMVNDRVYDKGGPIYREFRRLAGNGVGSCPHSDHRRQRRMLQPSFHRDRLREYSKVMTEEIVSVTADWRDGEVVDIPAAMLHYSVSVMVGSLFRADHAALVAASTIKHQRLVMRDILKRVVIPWQWTEGLPLVGRRRSDRARAEMHAAAAQVIDRYRRDGIDHGDVMSALLAARDEDGQPLTDAEILDQIVTFMASAGETAAHTLSWALHLLDRHPKVADELYQEVDAVLAGRPAVWDDLPRLDVTRRIVTESLRVHSPVWITTRVTTTDVELAGVELPAGTTICHSPHLMHRRADCFADPDRFDPDRWRADGRTPPPRNAYTPFSSGARKCMGEEFSLIETTLALASIASAWRLSHATDKPVRPLWAATVGPRELPMRLHRRGPNPAGRADVV
jgi:cytochrome P450